ncbi:MAG: hypothetical protein Q9219_003141 [cf. Caloplaca sp. 3 TL-2023]
MDEVLKEVKSETQNEPVDATKDEFSDKFEAKLKLREAGEQSWPSRQNVASLRSAELHYLWKAQLRFLLHPKVNLTIQPKHFKVAEIGTGSGVWLLDLAKQLPPTVTLHGFDIDTSLAPPSQWLPPNMTIQQVDNYTSKLTPDAFQAYDIIHVAHVTPTIKDNSPGEVIKNILSMLSKTLPPLCPSSPQTTPSKSRKKKQRQNLTLPPPLVPTEPNGYIQWTEADTAHRLIVKSNPSLPSPHLSALLRYVEALEHARGPRGWVYSLPDIFARYGLEIPVMQHSHAMPCAYAKVQTERCFMDFWEFARVLDEEEGEGGGGGELRGLVARAAEECRGNGEGIRVDVVVAVGRKEEG